MYKIWFLVWIWKRSRLGFWYKAPVVRIAHADHAAAKRLGRLFTFEDLFGCGAVDNATPATAAPAATAHAAPASASPATVAQ